MRTLVFAVLVALPQPGLASEPLRTTVHIAAHDSMDDRQLRLFDASLRYEVAKREGVSPISLPPSKSTDERCPEQRVSCLTRLANGLGADEVVLARAVTMGNARVLTLKRLRIQTAEITASVTKKMTSSTGEAYLMVLGGALEELYNPRPLRPEAAIGIPRSVLDRWQPPPLPSWSVWAGAGTTTAALVSGIVMGVLAKESQREYNDALVSGNLVSGSALKGLEDEANSRAETANVLYGVAAGLAVTTLVLWLFSDWGDDEAAFAELGVAF